MISSFTQAVKEALKGNNDGFAYLYENTYYDKYYIALKYVNNEQDAQDVLHDAYLIAWQKLGTLKDAEKFPSWLGMIVANTAKNVLVKKKPTLFSQLDKVDSDGDVVEYEMEDDYVGAQPEMNYTIQETQQFLYEMLECLPEEQKLCVLMYHIEDMKIKEIAEALECSENTVKSRLTYGRKALRTKCYEMQAKGYKLYSVAPIPFILYLVSCEAKAYGANAVAVAAGTRLTTVAAINATAAVTAGMENGAIKNTQTINSGMANSFTDAETMNAETMNAGTMNAQAMNAGTMNAQAMNVQGPTDVAKNGSSIGLNLSIRAKVAIASLCAAFITGAIIFGIILMKKDKNDKEPTVAQIATEEPALSTENAGVTTEAVVVTEETTEDIETTEVAAPSCDWDILYGYGLYSRFEISQSEGTLEHVDETSGVEIWSYGYDVTDTGSGYEIVGTLYASKYLIAKETLQSILDSGETEFTNLGRTYTIVSTGTTDSSDVMYGGYGYCELLGDDGKKYIIHLRGVSGPNTLDIEYNSDPFCYGIECLDGTTEDTNIVIENCRITISYELAQNTDIPMYCESGSSSGNPFVNIYGIKFDENGNVTDIRIWQ